MLIQRKRLRHDIGEQRFEVAALVRHDRERAIVDLGVGFSLGEKPRHLLAGHARRPDDDRDVELVVVEDLLLQRVGVFLLQGSREVGVEVAAKNRVCGCPHEMGPQRNAIVTDRAPRDVELVMPGVEVADVAGLERPPIDAVHAHERAVFESNQRVIDVPRVGNELDVIRLADGDLLMLQPEISHCRNASASRLWRGGRESSSRPPRTCGSWIESRSGTTGPTAGTH